METLRVGWRQAGERIWSETILNSFKYILWLCVCVWGGGINKEVFAAAFALTFYSILIQLRFKLDLYCQWGDWREPSGQCQKKFENYWIWCMITCNYCKSNTEILPFYFIYVFFESSSLLCSVSALNKRNSSCSRASSGSPASSDREGWGRVFSLHKSSSRLPEKPEAPLFTKIHFKPRRRCR